MMEAPMSPNIVAPDLTVIIAVEIVTELLRFIRDFSVAVPRKR
jgi:hypothetical protein